MYLKKLKTIKLYLYTLLNFLKNTRILKFLFSMESNLLRGLPILDEELGITYYGDFNMLI